MTPVESAGTKGSKPAKERRSSERQGPGMIDHLRELITALDRRVPRLERTGELDIARDAALLKEKALKRIAKLAKPGKSAS
jgi:hypothetical protein